MGYRMEEWELAARELENLGWSLRRISEALSRPPATVHRSLRRAEPAMPEPTQREPRRMRCGQLSAATGY